MAVRIRPTLHDVAMQTAWTWADRGTCRKKQVGAAVLTAEGRVIATGYNGTPPGKPHCTDVGCVLDDRGDCVVAIHAERNALTLAGRAAAGGTLYCTHLPCPACTAHAIRANVLGIWYDIDRAHDSKREATLWSLKKAGIALHHYSELSGEAEDTPPLSYLAKIAQAIRIECGESGPWDSSDEYASLWLSYAVLLLARGDHTTFEDVHDAWSAWAEVHHEGDHQSLKPFEELPLEVRALDEPYCVAIRAVRRQLLIEKGS